MLFLHKIVTGVWMIEESFASNYIPYITDFLNNPSRNYHSREPEQFISIYNGSESDSQIKSIKDAQEGSICVINIAGAITKHDQYCGPDGMTSKAGILRECFASKNIKGVILRIESGGGEGSAMRVMSETLSNKNKPVIAFIEDFACSAAYGIASCCDFIVANSKLAQVGSIGTYLTIADYENTTRSRELNSQTYTPHFRKIKTRIISKP